MKFQRFDFATLHILFALSLVGLAGCAQVSFKRGAQPDSMRHDIDGNPIEPLSPADRLAARQRLIALKQIPAKTPDPQEQSAPPPPAPSKSELIRASLLRGTKRSDRLAR